MNLYILFIFAFVIIVTEHYELALNQDILPENADKLRDITSKNRMTNDNLSYMQKLLKILENVLDVTENFCQHFLQSGFFFG